MGEIIFWIVLIVLNILCIINNILTEQRLWLIILNTLAAGACVVCLCESIRDYKNPDQQQYQRIIKTHEVPDIDTVFTKSNDNIDTLYIYKFPKQ